jgi:hypothetical protein
VFLGCAGWLGRANQRVGERETRELGWELWCSVGSVWRPRGQDKSQGPLRRVRRDFRDSKPDPAANIGSSRPSTVGSWRATNHASAAYPPQKTGMPH